MLSSSCCVGCVQISQHLWDVYKCKIKRPKIILFSERAIIPTHTASLPSPALGRCTLVLKSGYTKMQIPGLSVAQLNKNTFWHGQDLGSLKISPGDLRCGWVESPCTLQSPSVAASSFHGWNFRIPPLLTVSPLEDSTLPWPQWSWRITEVSWRTLKSYPYLLNTHSAELSFQSYGQLDARISSQMYFLLHNLHSESCQQNCDIPLLTGQWPKYQNWPESFLAFPGLILCTG